MREKPDWSIEIDGDKAQALFGHSVVLLARGERPDTREPYCLFIHKVMDSDPRLEVGELYANSPYINKSEELLPKPYIKLVFDNSSGLAALIMELEILRGEMLEHENQNKGGE